VIAEAADGPDAVNHAKQLRPDLILLDIGLPGQNGIAAAREIRSACPESKIVFVTQESSTELVEEALALGAKGYMVKSAVATELMTALDLVIAGDCFVGRGCGEHNYGKSAKIGPVQILPRVGILPS
jgi:DNA-binding NarL/FixJ family response regulator